MKIPDNFILIGAIGVGKSTLFNALLGRKEVVRKTQTIEYHNEQTLDTPGEYFENPHLYSALISSMSHIDRVIYVHPCNILERKLPPGLFHIYGKKIVGVLSKMDLADARINDVRELMKDYGIGHNIFDVSIFKPESIIRLRNFLLT